MKEFYCNGLHFQCQQCSYCCGNEPGFVYLSRTELEKLCNHFSLGPKDFVKKYCRWVNYYYGETVLALLEKQKHYCIFFENGCSVYNARPVQCSTFPFWDWIISDQETWTQIASTCPGINKGPLIAPEKIEQEVALYKQIKPITKQEFDLLYSDESTLD